MPGSFPGGFPENFPVGFRQGFPEYFLEGLPEFFPEGLPGGRWAPFLRNGRGGLPLRPLSVQRKVGGGVAVALPSV